MPNQQTHSSPQSHVQKNDSKLIDPQKIKSILSRKLQGRISNPEQIIDQLHEQIAYQIQKTEYQIEKEKQRHNKIKTLEERDMKARSLMKQKLEMKLQNSSRKKVATDKQCLEKKVNARKLKEEFIQSKKQQIRQTEFKKRFEKFKQIKALNIPNQFYPQQLQQRRLRSTLLKRSFSQRNQLTDHIQKSKEIQEIQYFKKLQTIEKKKVFQKLEPKVHIPQTVDKKEIIEKLHEQTQNNFIQKLGSDLLKIEQARKKKQKQINARMQKMKNESEFKQEQRGYRLETLKRTINDKQKDRRDALSKKNERFMTMRNKSTPQLMRNWSTDSQNRDTFRLTLNGKLLQASSRFSKTVQNFNNSLSIHRAKAEDYLVKEKEKKIQRETIVLMEQVLKQVKCEIRMK